MLAKEYTPKKLKLSLEIAFLSSASKLLSLSLQRSKIYNSLGKFIKTGKVGGIDMIKANILS